MLSHLTHEEIMVAKELQGNVPLCERPFKLIGDRLGFDEEKVLHIIKQLKKKGMIRRLGAIVSPRTAGYMENVMIVWAIPATRCAEVGSTFATLREVSHCYRREPPLEGKYTIFTMVHCEDREALKKLINLMTEISGTAEYKLYPTVRELKKTSMVYFP
ncbi:MAG: hypothetical protein N2317_05710 [Syntrophales bacterium]|nr:hypothetical protein [Syntrophales bacterium]